MKGDRYLLALTEFQNAAAQKLAEAGLPDAAGVQRTGQSFEPGSPTAVLRAKLIIEEAVELAAALLGDNPERLCLDACERLPEHIEATEEEALKEFCDYLVVGFGTAATYDWPTTTAFNRVDANNKLKLQNSTVRADGKILKPANHPKVVLKDLL